MQTEQERLLISRLEMIAESIEKLQVVGEGIQEGINRLNENLWSALTDKG